MVRMMVARRIALAAALLASPLILTAPADAHGGASFGIGIGVPVYPAYPAYPAYPYAYGYPVVPPPAYYAPPFPAYAPPPPAYSVPRPPGQTCYAGAYVCPLDRNLSAGDACGCLAPNGQRAWGRVG
ncbi:hypothetical protein [Roseomonas harenae]|uniref:hypothetical protein n=1 Tax=Muricoccus harenae TaxID=2692566 RepID=UPI0013316E7A|nr:hypothetical protein [Roseomonas harenae]